MTETSFEVRTGTGPIVGSRDGKGPALLLLHGGPWPPYMRVSLAGYAGTFSSINEHLAAGFAESLRGIAVPAVFVLGARSPMPVSQGQQTAALIPSAEIEVIPGAGHLPWHEQPGCVADALARIHASH